MRDNLYPGHNYRLFQIDKSTYLKFDAITCFKVDNYEKNPNLYVIAVVADSRTYPLVYNDTRCLFKKRNLAEAVLDLLITSLNRNSAWSTVNSINIKSEETFPIFRVYDFYKEKSRYVGSDMVSIDYQNE